MQARVILIGETEEIVIGLLKELITDVIGDDYHLGFLEAPTGEELSELTSENVIDLFIVTVNNVTFASDNMPFEKRLAQALDLIRSFKLQYQKPIIALAGQPEIEEAVLEAGADRFLKLPFDTAILQHEIRSLLAPSDC